jgi:spoIIIJ-associated protein
MASLSTQSAESDGATKEDALRGAFEELGVPPAVLNHATAEEIRDAALDALGLELSDLTIKIISEGTKGLLGLGSRPARVRVTIRQSTETPPEALLATMLRLMGVEAAVHCAERDGDILLNIETDDVALLIGHHGQTLDAIQYLMNCFVNRSTLVKRRVVVNAGAYREKRRDMLTEMAHQAARRVRATGREVALEPMNPRDRRIIHLALKENEDVRTFSRGEGAYRAVVVVPKDRYIPDGSEDS